MFFFWNAHNDTLVFQDAATGQPREIAPDQIRAQGWKLDELDEMRMARSLPRWGKSPLAR